ncbi:hypothetical protein HDU85_005729 [Gaertneriomyces sp. JEL0708]|nr:hypothetical protein HDU85_005729 [Gaertneriomyces sp. JEL0708]
MADPSTAESTPPSPPSHIIFIVHGMGRQERYAHNISVLRSTTQSLLSQLPAATRPSLHYIPIEWHTPFHALPNIDTLIRSITLPTTPLLRAINNDILADVLYYFTPRNGRRILEVVAGLLNEAYKDFMKSCPEFEGQICLVGHSLGGIIGYDLVSGMNKENEGGGKEVLGFDIPGLLFHPDVLLLFGSPLGAALVIRGVELGHWRPNADVLWQNVFHVCDPMAYRIEPLLHPSYAQIPPVLLQPPASQRSNFDFGYYRSLITSYLPTVPFPQMPQFPQFPFSEMTIPTIPPTMSLPVSLPRPQLQIPMPPLPQFPGFDRAFETVRDMWMWPYLLWSDQQQVESDSPDDDGDGDRPHKRRRVEIEVSNVETGDSATTTDGESEQCGSDIGGEGKDGPQPHGTKRKRRSIPNDTEKGSDRKASASSPGGHAHGFPSEMVYARKIKFPHLHATALSTPSSVPSMPTESSSSSYKTPLTHVTESVSSIAEKVKRNLNNLNLLGGNSSTAPQTPFDAATTTATALATETTSAAASTMSSLLEETLDAVPSADISATVPTPKTETPTSASTITTPSSIPAFTNTTAEADGNATAITPPSPRYDYYIPTSSWTSNALQEYITGLKAHFSYWGSTSGVWHIIQVLTNIETDNQTENGPETLPEVVT